jgi:hypothetical protein
MTAKSLAIKGRGGKSSERRRRRSAAGALAVDARLLRLEVHFR